MPVLLGNRTVMSVRNDMYQYLVGVWDLKSKLYCITKKKKVVCVGEH